MSLIGIFACSKLNSLWPIWNKIKNGYWINFDFIAFLKKNFHSEQNWFLVRLSEYYKMTSSHFSLNILSFKIVDYFFQSACPEYSFGRDCLEKCGRCVNNTCDHVNGSCSGPCQDGWEGEGCLLAKGSA